MTTLTDGDLGYLAAVIDLQARLWTRPVPSGELPLVEVSSTNTDLLGWLCSITGMKTIVSARDYNRAACAMHCDEPHIHAVSENMRWHVSGAKATILLWNIEPFMFLKRERAEELIGLGMTVGHKDSSVSQMRKLGWAIPAELDRKERTAS